MILKFIKLEKFRNYESCKVSFSDNLNIIIGENGQGKTNLLESIYYLGTSKSHRLFTDENLILSDESYFKVSGYIENNYLNSDLEIIYQKNSKNLKIDGEQVRSLKNYLSKLRIIIFYPDDLELIKGSPNIRRKFLDMEISQIIPAYLKVINEYQKVLKVRNNYLKKIKYENITNLVYLDSLNTYLSSRATDIYIFRKEFIRQINKYLDKIYFDLTNLSHLKLIYEPNVVFTEYDKGDIKKVLEDSLKSNLKQDIKMGSTCIGPHKDEFKFYLNDRDLKFFGSQGQQRLAIIALKLAEVMVIKELTKDYPILLLDDVFSEIDVNKKNNLIKYLKNDIQTIITTTDINSIDPDLVNNANIYEIKDANIIINKEV